MPGAWCSFVAIRSSSRVVVGLGVVGVVEGEFLGDSQSFYEGLVHVPPSLIEEFGG